MKGTDAPTLKIDGAGFSKGAATVTVCGVAAAPATGKVANDKTLYVTPPAAPTGVSATAGGVCTVQVAIAGGETSTITAGSTFTYAAY